MSTYLLAHDLGTSGNKATLFDTDGSLIKSVTASYDTFYAPGNRAEQNPEDWWRAVCKNTRQLLDGIDPRKIAVVAFSGQMMGCLVVDGEGKPLHPHLLYSDQRSLEQEKLLIERVGMEEVYRITGHRASASYGITKLRWLKDNAPQIFAQTGKMLNAKDYLNFRLTGEMVTDFNDASSTNAFDLNTFAWSEDILTAMEIPAALMPTAVASTTIIGKITEEAARATGLSAGTPVAAGSGDGGCATVGAGCVRPGKAYNYLGSSSWISTTSEKPVFDPEMRTFTWAHPVPGYSQPCGTMQTACGSYAWLRNEVARLEQRTGKEQGINEYRLIDETAAQSPPGAGGVLFLPYMLGERSPRWNPHAKGSFLNLNLATGRADLFRAVLEGVAMNLDIILKIFLRQNPFERLLLIGGGAKGEIWNRIMADIFNITIDIPVHLEEATSMGAAVIGGVGCGALESFDAVERFITITRSITPDQKNTALYEKQKRLFEEAYRALEPLFQRMK